MTELTQQGLTLDRISDELGIIFDDILDRLKETSPPPDQAPSHEQRQEMVNTVLDRAEQGLVDFARKHGMSEDGLRNLRSSSARLKQLTKKLVAITGMPSPAACIVVRIWSLPPLGDLVEQHPILFCILGSSVAAMLVPESWILRPLLNMMGFGQYGPIKRMQSIIYYC